MLSVTVGTNLERNTTIVPEDTTLREVLEDQGIDYGSSAIHLNGSVIKPGDLDKSFAELGLTDNVMLIAVQKAGNGAIA